jgi:hypothetical protein
MNREFYRTRSLMNRQLYHTVSHEPSVLSYSLS